LILIVSLLISQGFSYLYVAEASIGKCYSFYVLYGVLINASEINYTLFIEAPSNISIPGLFTQRSFPILSYKSISDNSDSHYINVKAGKGVEAFTVYRVEVCVSQLSEALGIVLSALENPIFNPFSKPNYQEDSLKDDILIPDQSVVETVVPSYEEWLRSRYGLNVSSLSKLGLAVTAAYFVYHVFFTYDPSFTPRNLDELLRTRRGDCDDMSRVLVNLLYYYNIQAVLVTGYVYVDSFTYNIPVEYTKYIYINNGPHTFVIAHIPGYGWVSLDLLAGSLLWNLFIFRGYIAYSDVPRDIVREFLDVHRLINATFLTWILNEQEYKVIFNQSINYENIIRSFNTIINSKGQFSNITFNASILSSDIKNASRNVPLITHNKAPMPYHEFTSEGVLPTIVLILIAVLISAITLLLWKRKTPL
jgi:hypothetical protein